ncbi:hypothetical protein QBC42DRAFT_263166 [Cladorrhinum samala]|uniref:Uncharacterized protein n=1 Tax=Cladorrhinum samala TaxID=585594 RepID=A0AAV9HYF5_9PEZI|nr:hypothetical protein QBC42DRAFT_263166 [Cladorrhinum samala]
MATGLMALVDDCIKKRWPDPKVHRSPLLDRLRLETTTNVAKVARIIGYYAKESDRSARKIAGFHANGFFEES